MKGSCLDCLLKNDCYKIGSYPSWLPNCPNYEKGEIDKELYDEDEYDYVEESKITKLCPYRPVVYTAELKQMAEGSYQDAGGNLVVTGYSPKGTRTSIDYFDECIEKFCMFWNSRTKTCKRV